jgi:NAD(P)-dependent dehydrogenase (short-subunit alcohol dehydrogenase family)
MCSAAGHVSLEGDPAWAVAMSAPNRATDVESDDGASLAGQTAVVTGGGRGIGKAIALELAARRAAVAVVARSADEIHSVAAEIERSGGRARAIAADVACATDVSRMIHEIEGAFGAVDLLVNNAGLAGPFGPTWETDPDEWWRAIEVNVRGPMLCSRAILPGMIARGRGRIVNVASGAGTWAIPYMSAYVTGKTALIRLSELLALEAAPHGIQVFAIEPGTVRTAMAESALQSESAQRWLPWLGEIFAQGRDVRPDRAARLVAMLASGRADVLSGRFFTILDDLERMVELERRGELEDLHLLRVRTADSSAV